jgi:hypothetical protein
MTNAGSANRSTSARFPPVFSYMLHPSRSPRERAAEAAPVSWALDPDEARNLRQTLESAYRDAREAAASAWTTGERLARSRLATELMILALAEQPDGDADGSLEWTGRRCVRHTTPVRTVQADLELEAG